MVSASSRVVWVKDSCTFSRLSDASCLNCLPAKGLHGFFENLRLDRGSMPFARRWLYSWERKMASDFLRATCMLSRLHHWRLWPLRSSVSSDCSMLVAHCNSARQPHLSCMAIQRNLSSWPLENHRAISRQGEPQDRFQYRQLMTEVLRSLQSSPFSQVSVRYHHLSSSRHPNRNSDSQAPNYFRCLPACKERQ